VDRIDARHSLEQLAGHMVGTSGAARRHVDFARIGLGISDEFGNSFGRQRWIYYHDARHADDAGDRRNVADEIEVKLLIERRVDSVCRVGQKERIAVRRRTHDRLRADIGGSA
jgi:hypothetical protein